VTVTPN